MSVTVRVNPAEPRRRAAHPWSAAAPPAVEGRHRLDRAEPCVSTQSCGHPPRQGTGSFRRISSELSSTPQLLIRSSLTASEAWHAQQPAPARPRSRRSSASSGSCCSSPVSSARATGRSGARPGVRVHHLAGVVPRPIPDAAAVPPACRSRGAARRRVRRRSESMGQVVTTRLRARRGRAATAELGGGCCCATRTPASCRGSASRSCP